jgi:AraC-like DNA-binding protein
MYFSKNFYQLIAEYRIAYAIKVLDEGRDIKIESLAYECGYNSTSSFNKYFKEMNGLTSSEYRNRLCIQVRKWRCHLLVLI